MEPGKAAKATTKVETAAKLNFACYQSACAYLQDLRIENNDPNTQLDDVLVSSTNCRSSLERESTNSWKSVSRFRSFGLGAGGFPLSLTEYSHAKKG